MKPFSRYLLQALLAFAVFLTLTIVALVRFVDPNQFKENIEKEVFHQTGYELTIKGPLSWKWFPGLALEIEDASIKNPAPFQKKMATVAKAKADLQLWPLFIGKLFVNVNLEELRLTLERNASGQTNWEPLLTPPKNSQEDKSLQFMLNGIKIEDATVTLRDDLKKRYYRFTHLNVIASNLLKGIIGSSNPIKIDFNLSDKKKSLGFFILKGDWFFEHSSGGVEIENFLFKMDPHNGKSIKLYGELHIDKAHNQLALSGSLNSKYFNLTSILTTLKMIEQPQFAIPPVGLQLSFNFLNSTLEIPSYTIDLKKNGVVEGNLKANMTLQPLNVKTLEGQITSKRLQFANLIVNNFKSDLLFKDQRITLSPIDYTIDGHSQTASAAINLNEAVPHYSFKQQGGPFEISKLLELFDPTPTLEGKLTTSLDLTTRGNSLDSLKRNLYGKGEIKIQEGQINQLDLVSLLKQTLSSMHDLLQATSQKETIDKKAFLNQELNAWNQAQEQSSGNTPFHELKASFQIANGVVENRDLFITDKTYIVTGEGQYNLNQNSLNYATKALLKINPYPAEDEVANYLFQTPVGLTITGPLQSPQVRPDLKSYFNDSLIYIQQNVVQRVITKTVDKALNRLFNNPE